MLARSLRLPEFRDSTFCTQNAPHEESFGVRELMSRMFCSAQQLLWLQGIIPSPWDMKSVLFLCIFVIA